MISIDKVTINVGVGSSGERLEKIAAKLESLTGQKVVKTYAKKRIPTWNIRRGMPIGIKTTLRKKTAEEFLKQCLEAVERRIPEKSFGNGTFAFGVREYIDLPGVKYDPDVGMFGFDVCVSLKKWGYRIAHRKRRRARIPLRHRITREETIEWARQMGIEVV